MFYHSRGHYICDRLMQTYWYLHLSVLLTCTCMLFVSVLIICWEHSSTSSSRAVLSGSAMKEGFSCRSHFLYTLMTFLVAEASQDGNKKAFAKQINKKERNHGSLGLKLVLNVNLSFNEKVSRGRHSPCYCSASLFRHLLSERNYKILAKVATEERNTSPGGRSHWRSSHCPGWRAEWTAPCHKHGGAPPQRYTNWNRWLVDLTGCCYWSGSSQAPPLVRLYPHLMSYPSPGCYCLQWQSGKHRQERESFSMQ